MLIIQFASQNGDEGQETSSPRRFGGDAAKSPRGDFRFRLTFLGLRNAR